MFTVEDRARARQRLIEKARQDPRITAAAEVGSLAAGTADQWSDLDLTFAVASGVELPHVLDDWTADLRRDEHAVPLFDLPRFSTVYRVFLLPDRLQVDLSFTPERDFGPLGPRWQTLFGQTVEREQPAPPAGDQLAGEAVLAALVTHVCIERHKLWMAQFWLAELRHHTLALACLHRGLPSAYARGFDALPGDLLARVPALLLAPDRAALRAGLHAAITLLLREAEADLDPAVAVQLTELAAECS